MFAVFVFVACLPKVPSGAMPDSAPTSAPPTPAGPPMAPEVNLTFEGENPETGEGFVYPLHCPATPRLSGVEVRDLLDKQRQGLTYPRGDGESNFDPVLYLPGPYDTLDLAVVRQAIGARPAPYFKYDDQGKGWHTWSVGRMLWYEDGPPGSDPSRPAGAFLCTVLQQLDDLHELNIGVEHPGKPAREAGANTGLYDMWWFGHTLDGAIVGLKSDFSYT